MRPRFQNVFILRARGMMIREVMRLGSPPSWRSRAPGEHAITMSGNDTAKGGAGDAGSMASAAAAPTWEAASRNHKRPVTLCSFGDDEVTYGPFRRPVYRPRSMHCRHWMRRRPHRNHRHDSPLWAGRRSFRCLHMANGNAFPGQYLPLQCVTTGEGINAVAMLDSPPVITVGRPCARA